MDNCDGALISRPRDQHFGERFQTFQPDKIEAAEEDESDVIKYAHSYKMTKYPRGKLIIVNINKICYESVTFERDGTKKDCNDLRQLFLSFGFVVDVIEDVNKYELLSLMTKASKESYKHTNTLFIAFLTHGQEKYIFATDGKLEIKKITSLFRGSNLAGKPKVFIIQACQGSEYMGELEVDGGKQMKSNMELPVEADFLYAYSSAPGFSSWRNRSGSWFIQILCNVFRKHGRSMDVMRMLTKVNNLLSERASYTDDPLTNEKKQISSVVSQLRKELYLQPPHCNELTSSV